MIMGKWPSSELSDRFASMKALWKPGSKLSRASIEDVLLDNDEAVLCFRWGKGVHLYGLRVPLLGPFREFGYGTDVETWEGFSETFEANLLAHLDTGLVENSRRVDKARYIELQVGDTWPYADDFDYEVTEWADPGDGPEVTVKSMALSGGWLASTARVKQTNPGTGVLAIDGSKDEHATLDSVHLVCHLADVEGLIVIRSDWRENLDVIGFQPGSVTGQVEVSTSFLDENFSEVRRRVPATNPEC